MEIARALVDGGTDRDALARDARALGLELTLTDEPTHVEVWPEHWGATITMCAMATQINLGAMGGVIGYRYEALPFVMEMVGIPQDERSETFATFRVLEAETLKLMRDRQEAERGR